MPSSFPSAYCENGHPEKFYGVLIKVSRKKAAVCPGVGACLDHLQVVRSG